MTDSERHVVSTEEALAMLPEGDTVHTFINPGVDVLVGADWEREEIEDFIRRHQVERTGSMASGMNHKLAGLRGTSWLFIETAPEVHDG